MKVKIFVLALAIFFSGSLLAQQSDTSSKTTTHKVKKTIKYSKPATDTIPAPGTNGAMPSPLNNGNGNTTPGINNNPNNTIPNNPNPSNPNNYNPANPGTPVTPGTTPGGTPGTVPGTSSPH